jgi:regulator of protease activity HflC (stomatin/prohibitin superfamily)
VGEPVAKQRDRREQIEEAEEEEEEAGLGEAGGGFASDGGTT